MGAPTLIVVSGPPGSGKTTLAHAIARAIPCPAICRDEIKEGIVHAEDPSYTPALGDHVTHRTFETFFSVLRLLLSSGVTVVAEAAFQHRLWAPQLEPMLELATFRIVHCNAPASVARDRIARRSTENPRVRASHPDAGFLRALDDGTIALEDFDPIALVAPSLQVDTTDGYDPGLDEIVAFIEQR